MCVFAYPRTGVSVHACTSVWTCVRTRVYVSNYFRAYVCTCTRVRVSVRAYMYLFAMHFCPGMITPQAESIKLDLQRGLDWTGRFTTHTTLNTEQNQLAIKVSADT